MCRVFNHLAECEEEHTLIRILVGVQPTLTRVGLVTVLSSEDDMEVIGTADYGEQVVVKARELKPHVALLGAALPGRTGSPPLWTCAPRSPSCRCAILGSTGDPRDLQRAVDADVAGYLIEDCAIGFLIAAVRGIAAGRKVVDPWSRWPRSTAFGAR
jgi:two-component system response regulator DesR